MGVDPKGQSALEKEQFSKDGSQLERQRKALLVFLIFEVMGICHRHRGVPFKNLCIKFCTIMQNSFNNDQAASRISVLRLRRNL